MSYPGRGRNLLPLPSSSSIEDMVTEMFIEKEYARRAAAAKASRAREAAKRGERNRVAVAWAERARRRAQGPQPSMWDAEGPRPLDELLYNVTGLERWEGAGRPTNEEYEEHARQCAARLDKAREEKIRQVRLDVKRQHERRRLAGLQKRRSPKNPRPGAVGDSWDALGEW